MNTAVLKFWSIRKMQKMSKSSLILLKQPSCPKREKGRLADLVKLRRWKQWFESNGNIIFLERDCYGEYISANFQLQMQNGFWKTYLLSCKSVDPSASKQEFAHFESLSVSYFQTRFPLCVAIFIMTFKYHYCEKRNNVKHVCSLS